MINIAIENDNCVKLAQDLGHHQNTQETVEKSLEMYLQQQDIIQEFGKIDYVEGYDYKRQRTTK